MGLENIGGYGHWRKIEMVDFNNENKFCKYLEEDYDTVGWRLKWDVRFLEIAKFVAMWSKDPSTKVGAVVVDPNRHILGTGFNGFPPGVKDTDERYNDRPTKYALVQHAERNAILQALKKGDIVGSTIYVWPTLMMPNACNECMKEIVTSGVNEIVMYDNSDALTDRWQEQAAISKTLAQEGGVLMTVLPKPWWETHDWRTATFHPLEHPYERK